MNQKPEIESTKLVTQFGNFDFHCFSWGAHEEDNILTLSKIDKIGKEPILCRVQSACYTAEIFRSLDCDCHEQLHKSLELIQSLGGLLIYLLCDGRGAGLLLKTRGLELGRVEGVDTHDAYEKMGISVDPRDYSRAAHVINYFGIQSVSLLTNNPRKIDGLSKFGIKVCRRSLEIKSTDYSEPYLKTKAKKMGHLISEFSED